MLSSALISVRGETKNEKRVSPQCCRPMSPNQVTFPSRDSLPHFCKSQLGSKLNIKVSTGATRPEVTSVSVHSQLAGLQGLIWITQNRTSTTAQQTQALAAKACQPEFNTRGQP